MSPTRSLHFARNQLKAWRRGTSSSALWSCNTHTRNAARNTARAHVCTRHFCSSSSTSSQTTTTTSPKSWPHDQTVVVDLDTSKLPQSILHTLKQRGFVSDCSNEEGVENLFEFPGAVYAGFDPTADSLHLGNLLVIIVLRHFQNAGHRPICLIGGATGMIGDPSGRSSERELLSQAQVEANSKGIAENLKRFIKLGTHENFSPESSDGIVVNNRDWFADMSFLEFLRDVGKHFRMSTMLAKESVRSRLSKDEDVTGMSFTEFSYQMLQAYDFAQLYDRFWCTLQIGGSDQWGNITAGIDYVHKTTGRHVQGLTLPLLTTANGEKFGKSMGNAIWLDSRRTSPYALYQHLLLSDDRDVIKFLKLLTFLPLDEIDDLEKEHIADSKQRKPHKALAAEVTRFVHGEEGLARALRCTEALFANKYDGLTSEDIMEVFGKKGRTNGAVKVPTCSREQFAELTALDVCLRSGARKSKKETRTLIAAKGLSINGKVVQSESQVMTDEDLVAGLCVVRAGKKKHFILKIEN